MTKNKDQLQSQLDALRGSINNTREQLAACIREAEEAQKKLDLEKQTIERWEPPMGKWYANGAGEIGENVGFLDTRWRRVGATSRTPEQAESKAKERIARELLQEWVYENGEAGDWVVVQDLSGRWLSLNRPEYYPGMVKMDRAAAERAVKALNNGTLVLEVNDD